MSSVSKFISRSGEGITAKDLSSGKLDIKAKSITSSNFDPNLPVQTDSNGNLITKKITLDQIEGGGEGGDFETRIEILESKSQNIETSDGSTKTRFTGDIKVNDIETSEYFSINDEIQKIENFKPSTEGETNINGNITLSPLEPGAITTMTLGRIDNETKGAIIDLLPDDSIDIVASEVRINGQPINNEDLEPRVEALEDLTSTNQAIISDQGSLINDNSEDIVALNIKTQNITAGSTFTSIGNSDEIFINESTSLITASVPFEITDGLSLEGTSITNVANPINDNDATTKQYVDDAISSIPVGTNPFDQSLNRFDDVVFSDVSLANIFPSQPSGVIKVDAPVISLVSENYFFDLFNSDSLLATNVNNFRIGEQLPRNGINSRVFSFAPVAGQPDAPNETILRFLRDPVDDTDAVNKKYVDDRVNTKIIFDPGNVSVELYSDEFITFRWNGADDVKQLTFEVPVPRYVDFTLSMIKLNPLVVLNPPTNTRSLASGEFDPEINPNVETFLHQSNLQANITTWAHVNYASNTKCTIIVGLTLYELEVMTSDVTGGNAYFTIKRTGPVSAIS